MLPLLRDLQPVALPKGINIRRIPTPNSPQSPSLVPSANAKTDATPNPTRSSRFSLLVFPLYPHFYMTNSFCFSFLLSLPRHRTSVPTRKLRRNNSSRFVLFLLPLPASHDRPSYSFHLNATSINLFSSLSPYTSLTRFCARGTHTETKPLLVRSAPARTLPWASLRLTALGYASRSSTNA